MITIQELEAIAQARLLDAEALIQAGRFDGATYICGYAIELSLKAKICKTLNWQGFPSSANEFRDYQSFKVHNLDVLLHLSGIEEDVKESHMNDWSNVKTWNPESRYKTVSSVSKEQAEMMLNSVKELMKVL
jgi:HEPN domain-containing protein